jgi:hypothetical protein
VKLTAAVPAGAPYRASEILHIPNVTINSGAIAAIGDDALHVAAYFGDTTGNGTYSALDAQRVLRVAAALDSGFAPYILIDPVVIGDITGNGAISSLDATRILQSVVGIPTPQIPPLPTIVSAASAGNTIQTATDAPNTVAASQITEVPYLTNSISIANTDSVALTNSFPDTSSGSSDANAFDAYMSHQLTQRTGKPWRFISLTAVK